MALTLSVKFPTLDVWYYEVFEAVYFTYCFTTNNWRYDISKAYGGFTVFSSKMINSKQHV